MYARDIARIATPLGTIAVFGDDATIVSIEIGAGPALGGSTVPVRAAAEQLQEYFAGIRTIFDVPLCGAATGRGQALRDAVIAIQYGETSSYGMLATLTGSSARAMGQACARNPFPIIVPCHRVLDASGRLGAYSAGPGPKTKAWLLDFEQRGRLDLLL